MNTDYLFTSNRLGFRNWVDTDFTIASQLNENSIKVMDKIGMQYLRNFEHPNLIEYPRLKNCVVYCKRFE